MNDPIEELYTLVEAIEACGKIAPAGLRCLLELLAKKLYAAAVALDEAG